MTELADKTLVDRLTEDLKPAVARLEELRQATVAKAVLRLGIVAAAAMVGGLLAWGGFGNTGVGILIFIVGAVVVWQWGKRLYRDFKDEAADLLMPAACAAFGDLSYTRQPGGFEPIERMQQIGVVETHHRTRFRDLLVGSHRATGFRVVQAVLTSRRRRDDVTGHVGDTIRNNFGEQILRTISRSTGNYRLRSTSGPARTVFNGLLFAIDVPATIAGPILIARDRGGIGNTFSGFMQKISAMQRVNFEDRDFEKRFEVYARDGDAARDVLGPKMRQTFCALDEMFSRKGVQAAFDEHKFFLAAKTKRGLTDPITVFKAMDAPRDVAATLADRLTLVHRVIDHLHGHDSVSGGRPGAP
ncbi:MAG: DUF3137 domain-containing protein [Rhodospirillaceae bacterium]|nr:DUF3137 domain-containing protein [Rhodospirillaceae bacterium]